MNSSCVCKSWQKWYHSSVRQLWKAFPYVCELELASSGFFHAITREEPLTSFHLGDKARPYLPFLTSLRKLGLHTDNDIDYNAMPHLTCLSLAFTPDLYSPSDFKTGHMTKICKLSFRCWNLPADLDRENLDKILPYFENLKVLKRVTPCRAIRKLTQLTALSFIGYVEEELEDRLLPPVLSSKLSNLYSLSMHCGWSYSERNWFIQLTNLTYLSLSEVKVLEPLPLPNLESFTINGTINNNALSAMTSLKTLYVRTQTSKLEGRALASLTNLEVLSMNSRVCLDIPLESLTNLQALTLSSANATGLHLLTRLNSLTMTSFGKQKIKQDDLATLTNLGSLHLKNPRQHVSEAPLKLLLPNLTNINIETVTDWI